MNVFSMECVFSTELIEIVKIMNLVIAYKQCDPIPVCLLESYDVFEISQSFVWRDILTGVWIQVISKENDGQGRMLVYRLLPERPSMYVGDNKYLC